MISLIREELDKEKPDWLSISKMAEKIYIESNKPNILGIRENIINLVKVGDHSVSGVVQLLTPVFPNIKVIGVGGYSALSVPEAIKEIKKYKDETLIIVTDRDALLKHLGTYQFFRCNISTKYDRVNDKIDKKVVKWTNVDTGKVTTFEDNELAALIRDHKINEILN